MNLCLSRQTIAVFPPCWKDNAARTFPQGETSLGVREIRSRMSIYEFSLFLLVGAAIGFTGGLFAIGGALIAIPVLAIAFSLPQRDAQGTAMVMALAGALVTMSIYARNGLLSIRGALIMTACSAVMGLATSQLVRFVPDEVLQRGFGAFLVVLAAIVWSGHLGESDEERTLSLPLQVAIGSTAGALSGFFVVGGALVSVPLLERVARYSQQRAQATVLLMLVPASALGLVSYSANGFVHWSVAVPLAVGAVALAPAGTKVAIAMRPRLLRRLFAIVQAAAGALLILGR
jgi:uncharacterized protein